MALGLGYLQYFISKERSCPLFRKYLLEESCTWRHRHGRFRKFERAHVRSGPLHETRQSIQNVTMFAATSLKVQSI